MELGSHSKKDFLSKVTIAYKEARETRYWLHLLNEAKYINETDFNETLYKLKEILKIIGAIQRTTKEKLEHS